MTRLLLIGPPGSGKGTQASRLSVAFGIPAISTGDIFRSNVAEGTPLGVQAKSYMDRGAYVPDSLTNELVLDRLAHEDAVGGFLLDGFPRTVAQVSTLDGLLESQSTALSAVVQLVAETEEVVRRLLLRASVQGRSDDSEHVIRERMRVYEEQTAPLIDVYAERDLVIAIDALGPIDDVTSRILDALGKDAETSSVS